MQKFTHLALPVACAMALPVTAMAQQNTQATAPQDAEARLRKLEALLEHQQAEIARLQGEVDTLTLSQQQGRGTQPPAADGDPRMQQDPATQAQAQATTKAAEQKKAQQAQEPELAIGKAQQEQSDQREKDKALVVREHAPLFQRKLTMDVGGTYSYYDRRQLSLSGFLALDAIFLGTINLDQSKASVYTTDFTMRYGLNDRLSVEANVPYVFRDTAFLSGGAGGASGKISEVRKSARGIGDVGVGVFYQLVKESASRPDLVASLRVRAPTGRHPFGIKLTLPDPNNNNLAVPETLPTGTGFYSATVALSAMRTYDPVILFGNLAYTYNFSRSFDDISPVQNNEVPAKVFLGNPLQLSLGMAIALNDRSAVSFSAAGAFAGTTKTKVKGDIARPVVGSSSNSASFNMSGTYVLPSGWTMSAQLGVGLTPDAPNYVLGMRASRSF